MSNRTERNEDYTATRLHLTNAPGTAKVRVGKTATMRVQITGPEKLVERIRCEVRGDVLHVSDPENAGDRVTVVSAGRGSVTSVVTASRGATIVSDVVGDIVIGDGVTQIGNVGGRIMVNGRVVSGGDAAELEDVRILVDVPHRTPITIDEASAGAYDIADIEGPLTLDIRAGGNVTAGCVATTDVTAQGAATVNISAVNGHALRTTVSGKGAVTVREGTIDLLQATVSGKGNITFGGVAKRAELTVNGKGKVRVNQVTESVNDHATGMGHISVHVPPRRDPSSFWS